MHLALALILVSVAPVRDDPYLVVPTHPELVRVQGPATVTLTVSGFVRKSGKRDTVKLAVRGGIGGAKTFTCTAEATETTAPKRPLFVLTRAEDFTVSVGPGVSSLSLKVIAGAGATVRMRVQRDSAAVASTADADEAEPSLVGKVNAGAPQQGGEPSFTVPTPLPPSLTLRSRDGDESFFFVDHQKDFVVDVLGPGIMSFDAHAHRAADKPSTLEPVMIGVLLDDVLVQTLAVRQGIDSSVTAWRGSEAEGYAVSQRALLQLQVPPGRHRVSLSLSDAAALGASIRPHFEKLPTVQEAVVAEASPPEPPSYPEPPPPLEEMSARTEDTVLAVAPIEGIAPREREKGALGVLAGAWFPSDVPTVGGIVTLEGVITPSEMFGIGFSGGLAYARYATSAAPVRPGDVNVSLFAVPATADVRLRAAVSRSVALIAAGGVGARLSWSSVSASGISGSSSASVRPIAVAHLTCAIRVSTSGELLVRGQYMPRLSSTEQRVDQTSTYAALVGYAF